MALWPSDRYFEISDGAWSVQLRQGTLYVELDRPEVVVDLFGSTVLCVVASPCAQKAPNFQDSSLACATATASCPRHA